MRQSFTPADDPAREALRALVLLCPTSALAEAERVLTRGVPADLPDLPYPAEELRDAIVYRERVLDRRAA
jgi:hypothetical protein